MCNNCLKNMAKNTTVIVLLGFALIVAYLVAKSAALANLIFLPIGVSFNGTTAQVTVGVQNPTSTDLTLQSIAGTLMLNGSSFANVSNFYNQVIKANSQTNIVLNVIPNFAGILTTGINIAEDAGASNYSFSLAGTANVNNAPFPLNINF